MQRLFAAVLAVACVVGSTPGFARGGGGGGHFDGGIGGGHFGGAMSGGHLGGIGGDHFGGRADDQRFGHYRGWGAPYGYYGDNGYYGDSGYYDPSTVAPDEQPTYPTAAYPYVKPPRSSCSTQTYKVRSETGGEASVNVVRC
jgi:hypothetical protein